MNNRKIALLALLFIYRIAAAQDTLHLMAYNLLDYYSDEADSAKRNPQFRMIMSQTHPDVLTATEVQNDASSAGFLVNVLKKTDSSYERAPFIDGYDTNSSLYFLSSKYDCTTNIPIHTSLRDINQYIVVNKQTLDSLHIFVVHLKASEGQSEEQERLTEVDTLRAVTNALPAGTSFIVCGDFNFYGATETGYNRLLQKDADANGEFYDPITGMTGTWNNSKYAIHHTQSPRLRSFDGGVGGGLDDRFDLILPSSSIYNNTGTVHYIANSTIAYGNDGQHYNDSINQLPNNAVGPVMANALYYAADHLPVMAKFTMGNKASSVSNINDPIQAFIYPNPAKDNCIVDLPGINNASIEVWGIDGRKYYEAKISSHTSVPLTAFPAGIYFLKIISEKSTGTYKLVHE